jgi:hypothetical protein
MQMKKITKLIKRSFTVSVVLFIAGIIFLEIGSRNYEFPISSRISTGTLLCNSENQSKIQVVQVVVEQRRLGKEPSREDLEKASTSVKNENMVGLNGVACTNDMIFLRESLSGEAKLFVARHEMEHVFRKDGVGDDCGSSDEEYCATISAAKRYPIGFIETIFSSLYTSAKESPTIWSFLFGSWKIFRMYIFPW